MKSSFLFERCETRWLEDLPHPESVRNLNEREDYAAALAEPEPTVHVRCFGPLAEGDEVAFMAADAAG